MILINVAAAAITAILAVSSGQNMLQTMEVSRQVHASKDDTPSFLLERFKIQPSESTENIVNQLHSFKRKELLELYLQSTAPIDVMEIQGEWDGDLLDNNSMIMVRSLMCFLPQCCSAFLISYATKTIYGLHV